MKCHTQITLYIVSLFTFFISSEVFSETKNIIPLPCVSEVAHVIMNKVRLGDEKRKLEKVLIKLGVKYYYINEEEFPDSRDISIEDNQSFKSELSIVVRNVHKKLLSRGSDHISIYFDDNQKVISAKCQTLYDGP